MFHLIKSDCRSVTARNIRYISRLCNSNALTTTSWKLRNLLPKAADCELWRTSLLSTLLEAKLKKQIEHLNLDKHGLEEMIKSLCVS